MPVLLRRFILWTIICCASAAPSFAIAYDEHDPAAMVVGVVLFILLYTAATSTEAFERFHRRPFIRRTLYIGYGLRLIMSAVFPLGIGTGSPAIVLMFGDLWPGLISIHIVKNVVGVSPQSFTGTLLTTIVQGALLNAILFVVMAVVYAFQSMFMTPPPERAPKGFDVVMPATPVAVELPDARRTT